MRKGGRVDSLPPMIWHISNRLPNLSHKQLTFRFALNVRCPASSRQMAAQPINTGLRRTRIYDDFNRSMVNHPCGQESTID